MAASKPTTKTVVRNAINGRFEEPEYAIRHPKTSVTETIKTPPKPDPKRS